VRHVTALAERVLDEAKVQCHWDPLHDYTRYPQHLRETIHMRPFFRGSDRGWQVGSEQDYAIAHHDGVPERTITPAPGRSLSFYSRTQRRWVTLAPGRSVTIPPIPPNPYLREPLERVMGRGAA
jgi:hypothetical protein